MVVKNDHMAITEFHASLYQWLTSEKLTAGRFYSTNFTRSQEPVDTKLSFSISCKLDLSHTIYSNLGPGLLC